MSGQIFPALPIQDQRHTPVPPTQGHIWDPEGALAPLPPLRLIAGCRS